MQFSYKYAINIFYSLITKHRFHSICSMRFQMMNNELISSLKELDSLPKINALDKVSDENIDFLNEIGPSLKKSFNLAAYVNSSETLQKLVKLNVNLFKLEKNHSLATFIVKCDFETDIKPVLLFLLDNGVDINDVGKIFSKNPYLLTVPIEDLKTKIEYFKFRKFRKQYITSILTNAPEVFNLKIQQIDVHLANIVKEYSITASEIREVTNRHPQIILLKPFHLKKCTFMFLEEMGFNSKEIKSMFLNFPKLWTQNKEKTEIMKKTFDYVHNTMEIPHEQIIKFPEILSQRISLIKERHLYLKLLNRDQYDPTKPLYVPLSAFFKISDSEFCLDYCKTCVSDFNEFIKTL